MMLIDVVMPMYKLIEYSDKYSKTSVILWQYMLVSNTFISNARLKLAKEVKQKLRNTLKLNF